jgi:hypothetical protein
MRVLHRPMMQSCGRDATQFNTSHCDLACLVLLALLSLILITSEPEEHAAENSRQSIYFDYGWRRVEVHMRSWYG